MKRYSTFGSLAQLIRLRKAIEREIGEIEYDVQRTKRRIEQLAIDLENSRQALREVDAYIKEAQKEIE